MANYINANNNRYKTNQLYKVEKENENLELKKRMTNVYKERTQRKETVWDRLSRARKVPSTENVTQNRSRPNLASKPSHRFQIMKQMAAQQQQQQQQVLQQEHQQQQLQYQHQKHHHHHQHQHQHQHHVQAEELHNSPRRPLTPNSATNRQRGSRKYHMQKAIIMPEIDNQGFVYVCKPVKSVKEIVTARSLNQSKSSIDEFQSPKSMSEDIDTQVRAPSLTVLAKNDNGNDSSTDSSGEYTLAPLMSSRSHYDLLNSSSAKIVGHFHEVLRRRNQEYLEPDELELVKNVIKSDERYHHLDNSDPKLFKDILTTQLQDILKHEYAVKQALRKLDSTECIPSSREIQCVKPSNEIAHYDQASSGSSKKLEVDVVFRNVPSLEKEIIILRALGEKLDATLKRTGSQRNLQIRSEESEIKKSRILEKHPYSYVLAIECHASSIVRPLGSRLVKGEAQEFQIAQKTIVELKEESNRSFYIPVDPKNAELKKTSFKKLKQNPDILIRHLKAKNSSVPFNVLDQDPVFFNNLFLKKSQKKRNKPPSGKSKKEEQPTLCEGGDSRQFYEVKLKDKTQISSISNVKEPKKSLKLSQPKNRRSIRRCLTPISMTKSVSPKIIS